MGSDPSEEASAPAFSQPAELTAIGSRMAGLGGWQLLVASGEVQWDLTVAAVHGMPGRVSLTREEALSAYAGESRVRFERCLVRCVDEGLPFDCEFQLLTPDARTVFTRGIGEPLRDAAGRVVAVHGACQDITALRLAQARVQSLEHTLHGMLETLSEGFVLVDADFRVVYINRIAEGMSGRRREHTLGQRLFDVFHRARGTRHEAEVRQAMAERTPRLYEELTAPPGSRWLEVRLFPTHDGGLALYCGDVTARKRAEIARRTAEAHLWQAQKMEALGTLAGGMAHDFNNVVAVVLGNAGLALAQTAADDPRRRQLEHIRGAGEHARDLVARILAFARRDGEETVVEQQPLAPVLHDALAMLQVVLPAGVELQAVVADEELLVDVDATSIQQVLLNLGTNAWQSLPDGKGRVEVGLAALTLGPGEPPPADTLLGEGRYAHVWVSDNGHGIDAATRKRLFEPFFTTKTPGTGTGMGLPVVHGIVSRHGGAVTVDSTPGSGSTFHVYLPLARGEVPAAAMPEQAADTTACRGQGERVLLVDDDPVVLATTEQVLRREGFEVTPWQDALQALEAFRRTPQRFDVAVTDFDMPQMSGLELAAALQALRPGLPVVLSSGFVSEPAREQARRAGVRGIVAKERLFEELGDVVCKVLRGERSDGAAGRAG